MKGNGRMPIAERKSARPDSTRCGAALSERADATVRRSRGAKLSFAVGCSQTEFGNKGGRCWAGAVISLLLALLVAAVVSCGTAAAEDATDLRSCQDIMFLGESRPIIMRLHLLVDGRPFADVWEDYVRKLFEFADANADGTLSADEIESPRESQEVVRDEMFAVLTTPGLLHADVNPPDGVLTFVEFAAFVQRHRGGPFQPPPQVASTADYARRTMTVNQQTTPGHILFGTLDLDDNGRITADELAAAPESIGKLDFDGDGASSAEELDHLSSPFGQNSGSPGEAANVPLLVLSSTTPTSELIDAVMAVYGGSERQNASSIGVAQLGFENGELADFDADGNERLDRDELRNWLVHPEPHVELVIRIGLREPSQWPATVTVPPTLTGLMIKTSETGLVNIIDNDVHLEVGVGQSDRTPDSVKKIFVKAFEQTDRDGNGYLDRDEVVNNQLFEESFNRFDRDSDGKVFQEELLNVVEGQIMAGLSRTEVTAVNRGKDLFEILDTNRDRRVSRREILDAGPRFSLWDVDADGNLAAREVPQLYQLVFDRGTPQLAGFNINPRQSAMTARGDSTAIPMGPLWFQKMDRNADGDVSRREFLGTSEQFDQLDTDGNDLIDAIEAAADISPQSAAGP